MVRKDRKMHREMLAKGVTRLDALDIAFIYVQFPAGQPSRVLIGVGKQPEDGAILMNLKAVRDLAETLQDLEDAMQDDESDWSLAGSSVLCPPLS